MVILKPNNSFAYDLALIKARIKGLRIIEWEGAKHESSRCRTALSILKEEFPVLATYCDQLHTNTFRRLESASPYTSQTNTVASTAITQPSNASKKPLPLTEKCFMTMAIAHTAATK